MCRGFSPPHHQAVLQHQLNVLQFNSILTPSTWIQRQITQVKGSLLQDWLPTPRGQSVVQVVPSASGQLAIPTGSSHNFLLGLINFLKQLTELREACYLLDHLFIIKGCNSGTARWRRGLRQSMWEGAQFASPLQGPLTPKCQRVLQTMSSLNPVLLGFYGSFIS